MSDVIIKRTIHEDETTDDEHVHVTRTELDLHVADILHSGRWEPDLAGVRNGRPLWHFSVEYVEVKRTDGSRVRYLREDP